MANRGYSWKNVRRGSTFSLPKTEHLGRLVGVAVVLALVAHVAVILGLKNMRVTFPVLREAFEIVTEPIVVREMEFREALPELQTEELAEPPEVAGELLDEIETLEELPVDMEIDMSPEVKNAEFDIEMAVPAMKGEDLVDRIEQMDGPDFSEELPEIGRTEEVIQAAAVGQVLIDPGEQQVEAFDPDQFNEELKRKGAGGLADQGAMDHFTPLATMAQLSGNALENTKGMIGSDLLFAFNKAELRESARNSLLKVALLIDKNPGLNCWIEGHTDTIGGDLPNGQLSLQRAQAVKNWLVQSMRINPERLIVIGYGKRQPLIESGNREAQAINRRVVIKMRRGLPMERSSIFMADGSGTSQPSPASGDEPSKKAPPKPILVKPQGPPIIPKVHVLEETPGRATIENETHRRAILAEEERKKAVPVVPGRAVPAE